MVNEKIKEIFRNIIALILKSNEINLEEIIDLYKRLNGKINILSDFIIEINNRFSFYEIRNDLDFEVINKKGENSRKIFDKEMQELEILKSKLEFNLSEITLNYKEIHELIEEIKLLIDEL